MYLTESIHCQTSNTLTTGVPVATFVPSCLLRVLLSECNHHLAAGSMLRVPCQRQDQMLSAPLALTCKRQGLTPLLVLNTERGFVLLIILQSSSSIVLQFSTAPAFSIPFPTPTSFVVVLFSREIACSFEGIGQFSLR
jgi:hypothetical protein